MGLRRRAALLLVGLSTGEQLRIVPRLAPDALLRRSPWLRKLRFFDEFFPRDTRPLWLRAIEADRNSLGGARSDRGHSTSSTARQLVSTPRSGLPPRREELLAAIKATPGTRPSELARQIGISANQVHALIAKAREEKLLLKKGKGYVLRG